MTATGNQFARSVLAAAADIEAAESRIRAAIIAAARAGDTATVIDLVTRWQTTPPVDIAKDLPEST